MNIQEYISSGIIESYVLGLASTEERSEFEKICTQYPEVLHARTAFEISIEKQVRENAIPAPEGLKQKLFDAIGSSEDESRTVAPVRKMNWLKYAVAACLVLLACSLYWNYSLQEKNKELTKKLNDSGETLAKLEQDIKVLQGNPAIKMARMDGTTISPQSFATVYWDTASHDVYLLVNNLPKPANDKQYQLWAFIDGKPVDMGLLDLSEKPLQLYRMKNAQTAQAFAITLEKRGNGPIPHGAVYVKGNP
ncbi:MAG TPA: anti-sigma factor [Chitinophagaceae bacterium]|nr:anti-sigma factor [Chitinophagaceae bacterium]